VDGLVAAEAASDLAAGSCAAIVAEFGDGAFSPGAAAGAASVRSEGLDGGMSSMICTGGAGDVSTRAPSGATVVDFVPGLCVPPLVADPRGVDIA
jgi:hypothetical protein